MKLAISKEAEALPDQLIYPPRRRLPRTLGLATVSLVLLLVIFSSYLILRPRVQPLSLPALPTHLSDADLGLANWQNYQRPLPPVSLNSLDLLQPPPIDSIMAPLEDAAGHAFIEQGQLAHGLAYLEAAALASPENLRYNDDYRLALRDHGQYAKEESFFSQQAAHIATPTIAISLAMAYVDEMRSCPALPGGLVCQAQYSSSSIKILDDILTHNPYNIIARYYRGLNYLYWPGAIGHLPEAQIDLQYAVALLQPLGSISHTFPPLAYTALGDVFAKDDQVDNARTIWLSGKNTFSSASLLESRLTIPVNQLVGEENGSLYEVGNSIETRLAIFWQSEK